ncbi:DUF1648 domain-containing protein, partial [Candidatus Gracilibacteria bacterium]|nr:DUF1648 domain-containing protein [Candidatus Gracilibacteria bacterium]
IMSLVGAYFFNLLPDTVPIHWDFEGKPDRMGSKLMHLIMFPIISLGLVLLFSFLPKLDPKKENYDKFGTAWEIFQFSILGFFFYIYLVSIFIILNPEYNISTFMMAGVGVLFIVLGNYMGKIRQNYFVGIKLPWTLANEEVWNKTHRFGGKMFMLAGLMFIVNAYFLRQVVGVFVVAISLAVIAPIVYAYLVFKKIKNK